MIDWVDAELSKWGAFMRGGVDLGYPSASVEAKMQDGQLDSSAAKAEDGYVPADVQLAETIVLKMPHELLAAAQVRYMCGGNMEHQSRVLSRRLKRRISRRNYSNMLDNLHHRYDVWCEALSNKRARV